MYSEIAVLVPVKEKQDWVKKYYENQFAPL
jgi:hypothetical protein